MVLMK